MDRRTIDDILQAQVGPVVDVVATTVVVHTIRTRRPDGGLRCLRLGVGVFVIERLSPWVLGEAVEIRFLRFAVTVDRLNQLHQHILIAGREFGVVRDGVQVQRLFEAVDACLGGFDGRSALLSQKPGNHERGDDTDNGEDDQQFEQSKTKSGRSEISVDRVAARRAGQQTLHVQGLQDFFRRLCGKGIQCRRCRGSGSGQEIEPTGDQFRPFGGQSRRFVTMELLAYRGVLHTLQDGFETTDQWG